MTTVFRDLGPAAVARGIRGGDEPWGGICEALWADANAEPDDDIFSGSSRFFIMRSAR